MRAVIQRVKSASVSVDNRLVAQIGNGLVVLLGVEKEDTTEDLIALSTKVKDLRIFEDPAEKMNLSIKDINGEILIVPEFTLCADVSGGRRPGFDNAATPEIAKKLFLEFVDFLKSSGLIIKEGVFGAHMLVDIENDGPVTFILDNKQL